MLRPLTRCANYCLSSVHHPVAAVSVAAASAFVALCSQPGVAASLAAPAIIPGLLQACAATRPHAKTPYTPM